MTIADHGGFDIITDITPALATRALRPRWTFTPVSVMFSTPELEGTATIQLSAPEVGFEPGEMLVVRLSLSGSAVEVASVTGFPMIPPALRNVTISGSIVLRDTVDASGRSVEVDMTDNPPRMTPDAAVELDRAAILRSPLVELVIAYARIQGGEEEAMRVRELLITRATTILHDELRNFLSRTPIRQQLLAFPVNFAPGTGVPDTQSPVSVNTPTATLRVGAGLGSPLGRLTRITRSNLAGGDQLAVIIANACLIRDLVRAPVDRVLGLSSSGAFVADDPFVWTGNLNIPIPNATLSLTSMAVFIDETQRLVVTVSATASVLNGAATVFVSLRVPISFTVTTNAGGLLVTLSPGPAAVLSSRVDVAWWVYAAVLFGGGPFLAAVLAIADAIADGAIGGPIAVEVDRAIPDQIPVPIPLPAGVPMLSVRGTSLFQADAPQRTLMVGPITMPAAGRDHDLVVRLA
jgi:hypothetical protein